MNLANPRLALGLGVMLAAGGGVGCGAGYMDTRPEVYPDGYYPQGQPDPRGYAPASAEEDGYEDTDPSAVSDFYPVLAPYGTWANDPNYGTVWVPDAAAVGADFAPYQTGGSWSYTDDGDYNWNSEYDWGYVPFHYGRWVYITARGWSWVPGRKYAPAWVSWRTSDYGYVGWAPMSPSYYWVDGYASPLWASPAPAWVFCPSNYLFYPRVHSHVVRDRPTIERIAAHSKVYGPVNHTPAHPHAGIPGHPGHEARARPSLEELGVPKSAVPAERGKQDPSALALATRSGAAQWKEQAKTGSRAAENPAYAEHGARKPGGWEIGRQDPPRAHEPARSQHEAGRPPTHADVPRGQPPVRVPQPSQAPVYRPPPPVHQPPGHQPPSHQPPGHQPPGHQPPGHQVPTLRAPSHSPGGGGGGSRGGGGGSQGGSRGGGGGGRGGGGRR